MTTNNSQTRRSQAPHCSSRRTPPATAGAPTPPLAHRGLWDGSRSDARGKAGGCAVAALSPHTHLRCRPRPRPRRICGPCLRSPSQPLSPCSSPAAVARGGLRRADSAALPLGTPPGGAPPAPPMGAAQRRSLASHAPGALLCGRPKQARRRWRWRAGVAAPAPGRKPPPTAASECRICFSSDRCRLLFALACSGPPRKARGMQATVCLLARCPSWGILQSLTP